MSTIGRAEAKVERASVGRSSAGLTSNARTRAASPREAMARGPLTARVVRMRNACLRSAAVSLGLRPPQGAELSSLSDEASLTDAVRWWQAAQGQLDADNVGGHIARRRDFVLSTVRVTALTLLGLAFSYGRLQ